MSTLGLAAHASWKEESLKVAVKNCLTSVHNVDVALASGIPGHRAHLPESLFALAMLTSRGFSPQSFVILFVYWPVQHIKWTVSTINYQLFYLQYPVLLNSYYDLLTNIMEN